MAFQVINPSVMPTPTGYNHAVRASGTPLFISGQVSMGADGRTVGKGDPAAQAAQVFANLKMVIETAGGSMNDIVKLTTYALDVAYRPAIAEARAKVFAGGYFPASTFVVVSGLASPDYLLEIEAVAML